MDVDVYHSYTQALRHPVIIGHVAGWRLPWALSGITTGCGRRGMSGLLLVTRPVWAHLGSVGNLAVFTAGRSPGRRGRSGIGGSRVAPRSWWLPVSPTVLLSPGCRHGVRNGAPVPRLRPIRGNPVGVVCGRPEQLSRSRADG